MRLLVRGDIDGFFGLALDNLVQLLLINALCKYVLGFDDALLYGRVLPAVAVSLLVGNLFYAWQAHRLAARTERTDVCALPYGINTVSLFAHVFFVMLPVKQIMAAKTSPELASLAAWHAGMVACLFSGLIEFLGAFVVEPLRRVTPRAALLSTLAGIALGFIALGFLFRTFAHPVIGLVTLAVVLLTYFGQVRFKGGLPGGLVAVTLGTLIAWATGLTAALNAGASPPSFQPQWYPPVPVIGDLLTALSGPYLLPYLSVIVPMGLFNLIGSLQNIESAEAAGDPYPTAPSLAVNGLGSIAAAGFGSPFPTTIYIGHPGWKAMGARAGYSTLNGLFFTVICCTGLLQPLAYYIPVDAGMAIVLWIGIVMTAQAFQATPREHAPAVALGLLPGVAAWGVLMARQALTAGGVRFGDGLDQETLTSKFQALDVWLRGAFALEQGFIFTSMILAAVTVCLIERRFRSAAVWCLAAAGLSYTGIMHGYIWSETIPTETRTLLNLSPWPFDARYEFVIGYLGMAGVFALAEVASEPSEGH